ncbi:MAG: gliding motility protein GldC [Bacteroidota bacterium]
MSKKSNIHIQIRLDKDNIPDKINWKADDGPNGDKISTAKAILLSLFDEENKETLKIDLWTKEMQVIEMDRFFFQTLRAMADTYYRATNNAKLASDMQKFVQYFGEQTEIIEKK